MPETVNKILSDLQPAEFPSLPELLLCELEALEGGNSQADLAAMVSGDVFLSARLLAQDGNGDLAGELRQCATRMGFARVAPPRLRFLKQLYLQSSLTRNLAEELAAQVLPAANDRERRIQQAGLCGLFLNIGALALEQHNSARYLELLQQSDSTDSLLASERRDFGIDHAQLGAAMMANWGAERFSCDAVRYHHHAITDILDATPLVRISWLANQLADEKDHPEAAVWADTLFDMQAETLSAIQASARAKLTSTASAWHIAWSSTRYLPLPATDEDSVLQQERIALRELRDRVEAESLLAPARERLAGAPTREELSAALAEAVRQLFGKVDSLLFACSNEQLVCVAGTPAGLGPEPLSIRCLAERSVIADSCLQNTAVFRLPDSGLTVIDQQVRSLLGADNFCCEPCVDPQSGQVQGMLVIGVAQEHAERYRKRKYLRTTLARELGRYLCAQATKPDGQNDVAAQYDRRIRDAIHEVNNPLGIIKNYLQLLSMKQGGDTRVQSEISFIKSEIDRVSSILETLKAGPAAEQEKALNINRVVTSLVNMFRGAFAAADNIRFNTQLDPHLPELVCSEDAIRQIVTNLVKNSAEAFTGGGNITIMTAGNVYMDGNRFIQLTVSDDGPGIAPEILDHLFSPGNSSKGAGHRGAGLSIVHGLVKNLRGQISCRTITGQNHENCDTAGSVGTEFTILLPVSLTADSSGTGR